MRRRFVLAFPSADGVEPNRTTRMTLFAPRRMLVRQVIVTGPRTVYPARLLLGVQIVVIGLSETWPTPPPTFRHLLRALPAAVATLDWSGVVEWRRLRRDPYARPISQLYEPTIDTEPYLLEAGPNLPIALELFSAGNTRGFVAAALCCEIDNDQPDGTEAEA